MLGMKLLILAALLLVNAWGQDTDTEESRHRHSQRHRHRLLRRTGNELNWDWDQPSLVHVFEHYKDVKSLNIVGDHVNGKTPGKDTTCLIDRVISSMERRAQFHMRHLELLGRNHHVLYGMNTLTAQLKVTTDVITGKTSLSPSSILHRIVKLKETMNQFQPKLLNAVLEHQTPQMRIQTRRFANLSIWGDNAARTFPLRRLNSEYKQDDDGRVGIGHDTDPLWPSINRECFDALLHDCTVPFVCRKVFLEEPLTQYALSHQSLYQIIGSQLCGAAELNNRKFQAALCQTAYQEAVFIADNGFHPYAMDVFAEYLDTCLLLGFHEFARQDWIEALLAIEVPSVGCAPNVYGKDFITTDQPITVVLEEDADIFECAKNGDDHEVGSSNNVTFRCQKKRVTVECLTHLGSVILSALATSLTQLIRAL